MARFRKRSFWGLGLVGGLIGLLLLLIVLLPYLINLGPLKEKILAAVSEKLGGRVQYERLDLSFFPRPRVEIVQGSVFIPEKLTANLTSLTVYPQILPLLRRKVQFSKLVVESPELRFAAARRPEKIEKEKKEGPFSLATLEEKMGSVLAFILKELPGLTADVKRGKVELEEKDKSPIRFEDIDVRVNLSSGNLTAEGGCRSNLWKSLEFEMMLNPETFGGEGRIVLSSLNLVPLAEELLPKGMPKITESQVDLDLQFEAKGLGKVRGELRGSIPNLVLQNAGERIALKGETLKGSFSTEDGQILFSLAGLDLENPQMKISGKFQMESATPSAAIEVEARDVDVSSTRKAMLAMVGKHPTFQTIFDFVRGGNIPQISLKLWGKSFADLGETEKILVNGSIVAADIAIPKRIAKFLPESVDLKDVKGEILISKGMLEGKNIEATWENQTVRDVRLRIGLEGKDAPFHVEGESELDLSQLSPIVRRLLKDEAVLQEIDRIEEMKGRARGRFALGESLEAIRVKVDVAEVNLVARYGRIPYELEISDGQFFHEGKKIGAKNLKGKIGKSSFSGLTGNIEVGERTYLEIEGGEVSVSLGELYRWLSSYEAFQRALGDIRSLNGTVSLSIQDLKGPLSRPEEWAFHVNGEIEGLAAEVSQIPGSTLIESARFEADGERISFKDAQVTIFDTGFHVSGSVAGYLKKLVQLQLVTQVDLAKLPPILKHFIQDEPFQKELDLIDALSGTATAKLILEVSPEKKRGRVEASDVVLSAKYRRVPFGLEIAGGEISYEENTIGLKNLSGRVGISSFAGVTAELDFKKSPYLEIQAGRGSFNLDEIYKWLTSIEALRDGLKDIKTVKGRAGLSKIRMKGPLAISQRWDFEAVGGLENVEVTTNLIPGPVTLLTGTFRADQNNLYLSDFHARALDASFAFSGTLYDYLKGLERIEVALSGDVTTKDIEWLSKAFGIKGAEYLKSPLHISEAHLSWDKSEEISFSGNLTVKEGPRIALDISQNRNRLKIDKLFIQDDASRATISMDLRGRALDVGFSGNLSERTLEKIFSGYEFQDGWMKGDIRVHVAMDELVESSAEGKLEVNGLSFPWEFEKPLEIDHLSLGATGKQAQVGSAELRYGGKRFSATGDLSVSEKKLLLDLDLSTESLEINEIMEALNSRKGENIKTKGKTTKALSGVPIEGKVRFKTESLTYDRFAWSPFRGEISLVSDGVRVDVIEANVCGISTPGSLTLSPESVSLDFRMLSKNQELHPTLNCLAGERVRMQGKFDLDGRIKGQGKTEELSHLLKGNLELIARKGRIYRATMLAKIFSVLNVTEILRGKLPEFGKEGLPYDSVEVKTTLGDGKLRIEEATLEGPTLKIASRGEMDPINRRIDMTVLVAPFRTIDYIIDKIPLVRYVLSGTLIAVPVKVRGNLEDPEVIPLGPGAVGSEMLGVMKRTLELPFKMINPFLPKEDKEKPPADVGQ
jgi:hypothetical protein